jgi:hypothetical protein
VSYQTLGSVFEQCVTRRLCFLHVRCKGFKRNRCGMLLHADKSVPGELFHADRSSHKVGPRIECGGESDVLPHRNSPCCAILAQTQALQDDSAPRCYYLARHSAPEARANELRDALQVMEIFNVVRPNFHRIVQGHRTPVMCRTLELRAKHAKHTSGHRLEPRSFE